MIAWVGSFCLSMCALPQLIKVWRTRDASSLSWGFLGLWGIGELGLLIEVLSTGSYPLIANYYLNIVAVLLLIVAKLFWDAPARGHTRLEGLQREIDAHGFGAMVDRTQRRLHIARVTGRMKGTPVEKAIGQAWQTGVLSRPKPYASSLSPEVLEKLATLAESCEDTYELLIQWQDEDREGRMHVEAQLRSHV